MVNLGNTTPLAFKSRRALHILFWTLVFMWYIFRNSNPYIIAALLTKTEKESRHVILLTWQVLLRTLLWEVSI